MSKIYISGKITGLTPEKATANFEKTETYLREKGLQPINPMNLPHQHGGTWTEYMKEDLKAMMDCGAIYLMANYKTSKGANMELRLARELGMVIFYETQPPTTDLEKIIKQFFCRHFFTKITPKEKYLHRQHLKCAKCDQIKPIK